MQCCKPVIYLNNFIVVGKFSLVASVGKRQSVSIILLHFFSMCIVQQDKIDVGVL